MKEYTLCALVSVAVTLVIARQLRSPLLRQLEYYLFLAVIAGFKLLVNGYLTGRAVVLYNPRHILGIRIGTIPLEDFLFGFSMVSCTILFWEFFKQKDAVHKRSVGR